MLGQLKVITVKFPLRKEIIHIFDSFITTGGNADQPLRSLSQLQPCRLLMGIKLKMTAEGAGLLEARRSS